MTAPQAGWYPNPDGSPDLRYWDGSSWTQQRRPAPEPAPETPVVPEGLTAAAPDTAEPDTQETIRFPAEPPPEYAGSDTMIFPPTDGSTSAATPPGDGPPQAAVPPTPPPVPPTPIPPAPPVYPPTPPPSAQPPAAQYPAAQYPTQYPPSAGFTPPPYYPPAATQSVTSGSGVGVAALIVGILAAALSLMCGPLSLPVAIGAGVLGFVGMSQANRTTPPGPKGMAIAGIVLAGVSIAITVLWVVLIVATSNVNPPLGV